MEINVNRCAFVGLGPDVNIVDDVLDRHIYMTFHGWVILEFILGGMITI